MQPISRRALCILGCAKLGMSTIMFGLAAIGSAAEWWDRSTTLAMLALALAVGQAGHLLAQAHCVFVQPPAKTP